MRSRVPLLLNHARSYEEKSLGVFEEAPADEDEEPTLGENVSRSERIGKYVGWHLRRQVAFDIWWLVIGIWLILILERGKIMDDVNAPWFNLFRISKSTLFTGNHTDDNLRSFRDGFCIRWSVQLFRGNFRV